MQNKKIVSIVLAIFTFSLVIYFIFNKAAILDFFGYYLSSSDSICGKEDDVLRGEISRCCPGFEPKYDNLGVPANGDGGSLVCKRK